MIWILFSIAMIIAGFKVIAWEQEFPADVKK